VEFLLVIFIFVMAYFVFELLDGIVGVFKFCAADDKWVAALAAITLVGMAIAYMFLS
jgi:hypothetical protein|tara:strand:- start:192 stop:362 length:171 start_codon:yes stop_codon:yes gene_type:complete